MQTTDSLRVAIIIGSTREQRFGPTVAGWFHDHALKHGGLDLDLIDLAETGLPDVLGRPDDAVDALAPRLAQADAFVFVTPEYNRGYPAALKTAIDSYVDEWKAKPVAIVSYGGVSGGLRGAEQLRQVMGELHAVTIRDAVSFHSCWNKFDDDGLPLDIAGASAAATALLNQLTWWARALRAARTAQPYPF
ncbi:NAD(P)H-dependent FMN reductase [Saccharopolyspora antimicrobica]|uniref:NAD(P)H-dependent FMN reductase n=1 Tax=Saccharopolyspora antimicrobica TaxID=455193 RepID=A0A1I5DQ18_9PSEU|nr:NAD(P)H-dependent oxidoreductase [Saccharopolyspora antimicrobica]RKT85032.1 NAD(P)H-dependent FMN reductase [Saccharopolyspora antimicrobica]SFO01276.1 NAD(P)H-dependent FMN reductase [Saccharopolyspora antimicrobica]